MPFSKHLYLSGSTRDVVMEVAPRWFPPSLGCSARGAAVDRMGCNNLIVAPVGMADLRIAIGVNG